MNFFRTFSESFKGSFREDNKIVIKCKKCKQLIRIPIDKGRLKVTCPNPKCNSQFQFYPNLKVKKFFSYFFILVGGLIFGFFLSNITFLLDIASFYIFFIFPVGAFLYGLIVNVGYIGFLSLIRMTTIKFSYLTVVLTSGFIVIFTFWLGQYAFYSDILSIEKELNVFSLVVDSYKNSSLGIFGIYGGLPISSPSALDLLENQGIGFFGIILFTLDHICMFFSLPLIWLLEGNL